MYIEFTLEYVYILSLYINECYFWGIFDAESDRTIHEIMNTWTLYTDKSSWFDTGPAKEGIRVVIVQVKRNVSFFSSSILKKKCNRLKSTSTVVIENANYKGRHGCPSKNSFSPMNCLIFTESDVSVFYLHTVMSITGTFRASYTTCIEIFARRQIPSIIYRQCEWNTTKSQNHKWIDLS